MMVSVFSKFSLLFVFGLHLFSLSSTLAQSRVNTKKLSKELETVATQQLKEAEALEKQANESQKRIDKLHCEVEASKKKKQEYQAQRRESRKKIKQSFENMVAIVMKHPEAAPLIRKTPDLIKTVPEIKQALQKSPWLNEVLKEKLQEYLK